MKAAVYKDYASVKGGVNNLVTYKVVIGYQVQQCFSGKTAEKKATQLVNKLNKNK